MRKCSFLTVQIGLPNSCLVDVSTWLNFNEHQNYKPDAGTTNYDARPCNSDYFNIYFWLEVTPNYKIKKELEKNRF